MKLSRFCLLFQADCCPCDSLFILPLFGSYVNLFFEVFSSFFLLLFWEFSVASLPVGSPLQDSFLNISPFSSPVKYLFPFFLLFFFSESFSAFHLSFPALPLEIFLTYNSWIYFPGCLSLLKKIFLIIFVILFHIFVYVYTKISDLFFRHWLHVTLFLVFNAAYVCKLNAFYAQDIHSRMWLRILINLTNLFFRIIIKMAI